jgi:hypothetical protein|nr:YmaF family protein [uncultured Anaerocolumna sp.]
MDNPQHRQTHVHEILGSVQIAELQDPHSHRFATISGDAIPYGTDHYHEVLFKTDFFREHYHEFHGNTTTSIPVGNTHVHYLESVTTVDDGHSHRFKFAALIDDPTSNKS